jgi:hypothetical protein
LRDGNRVADERTRRELKEAANELERLSKVAKICDKCGGFIIVLDYDQPLCVCCSIGVIGDTCSIADLITGAEDAQKYVFNDDIATVNDQP